MDGVLRVRKTKSDIARDSSSIVTMSLFPNLRKTTMLITLETKPNNIMAGQRQLSILTTVKCSAR